MYIWVTYVSLVGYGNVVPLLKLSYFHSVCLNCSDFGSNIQNNFIEFLIFVN
jgi:hypothetical protein